MQQTQQFIMTGKVQGVGFRAATQAKARELQLTGWVRNLDSGQVEVQATGTTEQLNQLEDWLQHGPSSADVTDVQAKTINGSVESSFDVRY